MESKLSYCYGIVQHDEFQSTVRDPIPTRTVRTSEASVSIPTHTDKENQLLESEGIRGERTTTGGESQSVRGYGTVSVSIQSGSPVSRVGHPHTTTKFGIPWPRYCPTLVNVFN